LRLHLQDPYQNLAMPKNALIIYNPTARSQQQSEVWIGKIVEELNKREEYLVTLYPTTAETTPHDLVPLLKPPLDLVIPAGGDGTVRFALAALAEARSDIPAAILPLGTGNVLARNLGIVKETFFADALENAYDNIVNGHPIRIDMGMMNGEYFAGMTGAGPISDAFLKPGRDEKTQFKMLAYATAMIETISMPPVIFKITTGGRSFKVEASGIFVGNVEDLGLGKPVDINVLSDGFLDLHILNPKNFGDYVNVGFRFAGGEVEGEVPDYVLKVKEALIEVMPRRGVRSSFQRIGSKIKAFFSGKAVAEVPRGQQIIGMIDGEAHGTTPLRVTVIPQAVSVLVPPEREQMLVEQLSDNDRQLQAIPDLLPVVPPGADDGIAKQAS
jgi:diacylglycerol kinase family enzyme